MPANGGDSVSLVATVAEYLDEVKLSKKAKTHAAYNTVIHGIVSKDECAGHRTAGLAVVRRLPSGCEGSGTPQRVLDDVGGVGLANLRSAVHRAATSHGLAIETLADEKNFYVWKVDSSK